MSTWFGEQRLADCLGVTRSALIEFRTSSLKKKDWKKEGRQVALSESAVKSVLASLGCPNVDVSSCAIGDNGQAPEPQLVDLTVHRIFPNPRLILAIVDDSGEIVRVMVPSNVNFQPRMKIKAWPPHNKVGPQLYRLHGRCPRYRGRW
jgi:hypothetical protein